VRCPFCLSQAQQYRFTAAELVPAARKPMAIAAVLSGGIVGAVVGPEYAKRARLLLPRTPYAGVFVIAAGMGALNAALVGFVRFPPAPRVAAWPAPRELASPPARAAACAVAALSWYVMTFLMTPVPLAMLAQAREHSFLAFCFLSAHSDSSSSSHTPGVFV
jgi:hypothetical protein